MSVDTDGSQSIQEDFWDKFEVAESVSVQVDETKKTASRKTRRQRHHDGKVISRAKFRQLLISEFGNKCQRCGYDKCIRALQFHHKDKSEKKEWADNGGSVNPDEIRAHPERFLLLCANCHFEEHDAIHKANRPMTNCQRCGKSFPVRPHKLKDGKGKFCGRACSNENKILVAQEKIIPRFWGFVVKSDGCWGWSSTKTDGHAQFYYTDADGRHLKVTAGRFSWEIHFGPIPEGMEICRTCGNACCTRPDHLFLGTRSDSRQNLLGLGLYPVGEASHNAKVTEAQVVEIRRRYDAGGISQAKLGREFGLSQITVGEIVRRLIWKHVP